MPARRIAIIGAGPIGLEAALGASRRGFEVRVYEAGQVGEHLRRFASIPLFTPFGMSSSAEGRERLRSEGVALASESTILTAGDLVEGYLVPLARLPELADSIRERERVTHVGREGLGKAVGVGRGGRGFLLRVEAGGATRFDRADVVVDATGVYGNPNATGPGGLPALGEDQLGDAIARHWDDTRLHSTNGPYARGTTLLIGDGHSAATALLGFDQAARAGASLRVHWISRMRRVAFAEIEGDALPARLDLARRANEIASSAPWLTRHSGAHVVAYERRGDRVRVALTDGSSLDVDRVLALVGYRPDLAMTRELQVHYCYASEGTMKLASAILGAGAGGDCLAQVAHGPESLQNPEPDFFVLGAKSYGRNPQFLLSIGHQQVRDALQLMGSVQGTAAPALAR
ncbi:MAG TPA: FAD-dependent oxidoreductase [Candidatus Eisenbacteria bacterium]|jgi:hypothetical protein|nr:FAD-dependent oxidoreductase [Candidatus Eisenbacteria bacterium]